MKTKQPSKMKKLILTLIILAGTLTACEKENQEKGFSLKGTSWENSWFNADNVIWYNRLDFTADNEVIFSNTFTKNKLMSAAGKSTLKYTIENPDSASPKIHITGTYNNVAGEPGKGAVVDYTLTYVAPSGIEEAKLAVGDAVSYVKVVYK